MKRMNLVQMKVRQSGRIVEIEGGQKFVERLASMGVGNGKLVIKLSAFVLRGPVAIKVERTVLALGHGMAKKIWVTLEKH